MDRDEQTSLAFRGLAAEFARQARESIKQARQSQGEAKMETKKVTVRVGQKVNAKLNDGNNTVVTGKVLKVNVKGKAVVEVEGRGKCIIPLHAITPAAQGKEPKPKAEAAEMDATAMHEPGPDRRSKKVAEKKTSKPKSEKAA